MDRSNGGGRKKWVSGESKGVKKRGDGLNMGGPAGSGGGGFLPRRSGGQSGGRGKPGGLMVLVILAVLVLTKGGSMITGGPGGSSGVPGNGQQSAGSAGGQGEVTGWQNGGSPWQGSAGWSGGSVNGWSDGSGNSGVFNTETDDSAREKRTVIKGQGRDTVTVMVYMCGTDLESKGGMATSDLQEMAAAKLGSQVKLLVYTGGCTKWRNSVVNSHTNQIYQVHDGGLDCLVEDAGDKPMTKPETLTEFITWGTKHFPANRYELIFWDHGGGSVSGYGYDQKYPQTGSMNLAGINQALTDAGVAFDFIGFDACLMATMENALMLSRHGDYLIASEETEPGLGWYYTDWLTKLSQNPSMPTPEIGKKIADDFVDACTRKGQGKSLTLSVIDLAELEVTAPEALSAFSKSTGELIRNDNYHVVSEARSGCREFARSSGIDQVDLIHLAENMGTEEGKRLAEVLRSAVKYNLTSNSMTNSYGLSIYFPYKKISSVDKMVRTYEQIGMDQEYSRCIQEFASVEVSGQAAAGGTGSPLPVLLGMSGGSGNGGTMDAGMLSQLFETLLSGGYSGIAGLDSSNSGFLSGRAMQDAAGYLEKHQFDESRLVWDTGDDGQKRLCLSDEQWDLIQMVEFNLFYDDGGGYIDLGLDNLYEFDGEGNLLGVNDRTWLAINGQPVAYYFMDEVREEEDYTIRGRVPAMLNDERVNLILIFDTEHPHGYIAGAETDYDEAVTDTMAKGLTALQPGDRLDFLCDYYSYDGEFLDNYYLGDPMTIGDEITISNVDVGEGELRATYRLTDIYRRHYWTPPLA